VIEGDITLFDETGSVLVEVLGVRAQALTRSQRDELEDIDQWLYEFAWQNVSLEPAPAHASRWLVFMDEAGVAAKLTSALCAQGAEEIIRVRPGKQFCREEGGYIIDPQSKTDKEYLLKETMATTLDGIAYCWALDAHMTDADPLCLTQATAAVELIQALSQVDVVRRPPLFIVTRGAQPVTLETADGYAVIPESSLAQTSLIGLVRVAINEYAELRLRLIDIDESSAISTPLAQEMLAQSEEEEVVLRKSERYVHRLVRKRAQDLEAESPGIKSSMPLARVSGMSHLVLDPRRAWKKEQKKPTFGYGWRLRTKRTQPYQPVALLQP